MDNIDSILPTLIQLPVVAAFIWYSLRVNKDSRDSMSDQTDRWVEILQGEQDSRKENNEATIEAMKELTDSMTDLAKSLSKQQTAAAERHHELMNACQDK